MAPLSFALQVSWLRYYMITLVKKRLRSTGLIDLQNSSQSCYIQGAISGDRVWVGERFHSKRNSTFVHALISKEIAMVSCLVLVNT